jgi:hypothetical protein
VDRRRDESDARSSVIVLTSSGRRIAQTLARETGLDDALSGLTPFERATTLAALLELLTVLHRRGVISVARMCLTCRHMETEPSGRRCALIGIALDDANLRVDCPEHVPESLIGTGS